MSRDSYAGQVTFQRRCGAEREQVILRVEVFSRETQQPVPCIRQNPASC